MKDEDYPTDYIARSSEPPNGFIKEVADTIVKRDPNAYFFVLLMTQAEGKEGSNATVASNIGNITDVLKDYIEKNQKVN